MSREMLILFVFLPSAMSCWDHLHLEGGKLEPLTKTKKLRPFKTNGHDNFEMFQHFSASVYYFSNQRNNPLAIFTINYIGNIKCIINILISSVNKLKELASVQDQKRQESKDVLLILSNT